MPDREVTWVRQQTHEGVKTKFVTSYLLIDYKADLLGYYLGRYMHDLMSSCLLGDEQIIIVSAVCENIDKSLNTGPSKRIRGPYGQGHV